mmetsp:Transcript_98948/g.279554  ORF Transcript_98948/g.279554 Transcript_98948/m.279554 type:complete len:202 (+) Transcript_98948:1805-2410(+)
MMPWVGAVGLLLGVMVPPDRGGLSPIVSPSPSASLSPSAVVFLESLTFRAGASHGFKPGSADAHVFSSPSSPAVQSAALPDRGGTFGGRPRCAPVPREARRGLHASPSRDGAGVRGSRPRDVGRSLRSTPGPPWNGNVQEHAATLSTASAFASPAGTSQAPLRPPSAHAGAPHSSAPAAPSRAWLALTAAPLPRAVELPSA